MGAGMMPQIMAMLKSQSGMGSGVPGGAATGGSSADEGVGPASRQLQSSDPGYVLKQVNDLKKQIADLIPSLAFSAPAASRNLVSCFKGLDGAIKELQQAQATKNAVGPALNMSAIPTPQPPGGTGAPQILPSASVGI